jgi:hypothetical protein
VLHALAKQKVTGCTGCVHPGIDFDKNSVEVLDSDLELRDQWITDSQRHVSEHPAGVPAVKVDVAVAKLWRVNPIVPPLRPVPSRRSAARKTSPSITGSRRST